MTHAIHNGRPHAPGQPRRQLGDQLDRFDQILDGLAEGLQGAITDAAREGARLAVADTIREILTNPDLRAAVQGLGPTPAATAPPPAATRSAWARLKALLRRARAAVAGAVLAAGTFVVRQAVVAVTLTVTTGKVAHAAWRMKRAVLATAVGGVAVGVAAYYAAPHAGAALCAAAGAAAAVGARFAWRVRAALRLITLT